MKELLQHKELPTDFVPCVPWGQIETRWGKREYNRFIKWMRGQTCLVEGAYLSDVKYYAEERNLGINNPNVHD